MISESRPPPAGCGFCPKIQDAQTVGGLAHVGDVHVVSCQLTSSVHRDARRSVAPRGRAARGRDKPHSFNLWILGAFFLLLLLLLFLLLLSGAE
eukprot:4064315-Pyramimonas_sp.AAC.1